MRVGIIKNQTVGLFRQRVWSVVSLSAGCLSVSGICSLCCVDIVSACVDGDGDREFADGQPGDGFRSQIFKCDHLHVGDAFSQEGAGTADGHQIQ